MATEHGVRESIGAAKHGALAMSAARAAARKVCCIIRASHYDRGFLTIPINPSVCRARDLDSIREQRHRLTINDHPSVCNLQTFKIWQNLGLNVNYTHQNLYSNFPGASFSTDFISVG